MVLDFCRFPPRSCRVVCDLSQTDNAFQALHPFRICGMSMTTVDNSNPYTPMVWVPPELSRGVSVHLYVAVGSLAVSNLFLSRFSRFR